MGKGCCRHQLPTRLSTPRLSTPLHRGTVGQFNDTKQPLELSQCLLCPISRRQSKNTSGRTVAEHFLVNCAAPRGYPVLSNSTNTWDHSLAQEGACLTVSKLHASCSSTWFGGCGDSPAREELAGLSPPAELPGVLSAPSELISLWKEPTTPNPQNPQHQKANSKRKALRRQKPEQPDQQQTGRTVTQIGGSLSPCGAGLD